MRGRDLSGTELQVMKLLVDDGLGLVEIGERLKRSTSTISTHIHRAARKLAARSTVQAAVFFDRRRRQAGLGTVELMIGVAAIGLIVAAGLGVKAMIDDAFDQGYTGGREKALLEVARRDLEDLETAAERIRKLEADKDAQQRAHRDALAAIDTQHQEALRHAHADKDRIIADLRSGARQLRRTCRPADARGAEGGGDPAARAADPAGERDAQARGGPGAPLDRADDDAIFTLELLAEGDDAITDLTACQAIVLDDRRPREHPPP